MSSMSGYDPFDMVAIDYERSRRKGREIENSDDWNEMMEAFEKYGFEDEPLRVYRADDFTPEAIDLIKDLADSYRKICKLLKVTRYPGFDQELGLAFSKVEAAKQMFLEAFKDLSRSETEEDMLIEIGRILIQVNASEWEIAEMYEKENTSEDFLYAGLALLRDAEVNSMGVFPHYTSRRKIQMS